LRQGFAALAQLMNMIRQLARGVVAISASAAVSYAQQCTPFWTSASPFSPSYFTLQQPEGNVAYAALWEPPRVYRFTGAEWALLDMTGTNPDGWQVQLHFLDAGDGGKLYMTYRVGGSDFESFYWSGSNWVEMPPNFFSRRANPIGWGDFGQGPRAIARLDWFVVSGQPLPNWSPGFGYWDGTQWIQIATLSGPVNWAKVWMHEGHFHLVGDYGILNGTTGWAGLARWDGQEWTRPWPNVMPSPFGRFYPVEFDDGTGPTTYVANLIQWPDERPTVMKWTGTDWQVFGHGTSSLVTPLDGLVVFDDGRGPSLYIAGSFTHFNNFYAPKMVRWDGMGFEQVPGATGVITLSTVNTGWGDAMFAWISITNPAAVGGGVVRSAAFYVGCPNCYANCDLSTTAPALNIADFSCFLQKYARNDPYANCNVDGVIDIADFSCYLQKFSTGCP
jgi:hypothetical protein